MTNVAVNRVLFPRDSYHNHNCSFYAYAKMIISAFSGNSLNLNLLTATVWPDPPVASAIDGNRSV
jgi:hypothetical protein